jgi:beta-galactosidase
MTLTLMQAGTFTLGCNYWASHAGTRMWTDWRADVVERDLAALAAAGLTTLRVFPLWSDFQPVIGLRGGGNMLKELALKPVHGDEQPLPDTVAGQAGVDEVMLGRFAEFCAIAERHGLGLVVGLITGWMSGRTYCCLLYTSPSPRDH